MIFAVVAFVLNDAPVLTLRSQRTFETMAECEAFLAGEAESYNMTAKRASKEAGDWVVAVAWCMYPQSET